VSDSNEHSGLFWLAKSYNEVSFSIDLQMMFSANLCNENFKYYHDLGFYLGHSFYNGCDDSGPTEFIERIQELYYQEVWIRKMAVSGIFPNSPI
jgi:hypothetical protein